MDDRKKTKKQLIDELKKLRKRIAELEESENNKSKQIEKKLISEQAMFECFLNNIPISVYFKDKDGRYLRVGRYFVEQKGAPPVDSVEELIGKTDFDLFPKELAKLARADELKIMKTGEPIINREESEIVDGEKVHLLTTKAPLTDEKDNIIGIMGITGEVTEKKILDKKIKERLEALDKEIVFKSNLLTLLLNNIPDLIYFKDRKSRFVELSKSKANQVALPREEVLGKTDFDYFTKEHAEQAYRDEQEIIKTGKPVEAKVERETHPDGRVTWVSTTKLQKKDRQV